MDYGSSRARRARNIIRASGTRGRAGRRRASWARWGREARSRAGREKSASVVAMYRGGANFNDTNVPGSYRMYGARSVDKVTCVVKPVDELPLRPECGDAPYRVAWLNKVPVLREVAETMDRGGGYENVRSSNYFWLDADMAAPGDAHWQWDSFNTAEQMTRNLAAAESGISPACYPAVGTFLARYWARAITSVISSPTCSVVRSTPCGTLIKSTETLCAGGRRRVLARNGSLPKWLLESIAPTRTAPSVPCSRNDRACTKIRTSVPKRSYAMVGVSSKRMNSRRARDCDRLGCRCGFLCLRLHACRSMYNDMVFVVLTMRMRRTDIRTSPSRDEPRRRRALRAAPTDVDGRARTSTDVDGRAFHSCPSLVRCSPRWRREDEDARRFVCPTAGGRD